MAYRLGSRDTVCYARKQYFNTEKDVLQLYTYSNLDYDQDRLAKAGFKRYCSKSVLVKK